MAAKALADLKEAKQIVASAQATKCNDEIVNGVFDEFYKLYPEVVVPDAVKRRRPTAFGLVDLRSRAQEDQAIKFAAADDLLIGRYNRRIEALRKLKKRSASIIEGLNANCTFVNSANYDNKFDPRGERVSERFG